MFCGELSRYAVNQELPTRGHLRKPKYKIGGIARQVLADEHHGGTHAPPGLSDCQVLRTHALSVDPDAETYVRSNHFLWAMPETARSHGDCGRFGALFPKKSGLVATTETRTTREKAINGVRGKPRRVGNLRLPRRNYRGSCLEHARYRRCESAA